MKKRFIVLLLCFVMIVALSACGKTKTDPLVGTWIGEYGSIVFRSDGTGVLQGATFNWYTTGNQLHLSSASLGIDYTLEYNVSGNSLYIEENGTFTRQK